MAVGDREQNRDITLPPDSYLYLVNEGKGGLLTVHRGPTVVNQTGQDQPQKYDPGSHTFRSCSLEQAVQICPRANEGDYVVLENPAQNNKFPSENTQQATQLLKGRKVVIPGPWCEALWPGQSATIVQGHRLRTNQYVVAIVYNAEEAEKNWEETVAVSQTGEAAEETSQKLVSGLPRPESFAVGTRIVIKGSDVSFYIPCTGVEVELTKENQYVREAVTLEQLEYCCLIDEGGKKEYPRGPQVVFPKPTQVFEEDRKKRRKFAPVELNRINGIHLKVTADFIGPDIENDITKERKFKEGEELFVTGKTLSIYYPIEELSVIEYGQGNKKHFSTAIPLGEGRYVLERETGRIRLERGYKMFLADPRTEIPVRRVLSADECNLWYPGNADALAYNRQLQEVMAQSPSGRSGIVSEGDVRKSHLGMRSLASAGTEALYAGLSPEASEADDVGEEGGASNSITRSTKFTPPRQITLNTKFDGVPRIEVFPGYAVLIVGSEGDRRVEQGPKVILLEYDERLGRMELSGGKPKTTDKLIKTAYLCIQNNQVGDIVAFESSDHVKGTIKISLRVNFEAETEEDRLKWFSVDNYVKYLTDHVRSIVAGMGKRFTVAEIKANYINLVRDAILGIKTSPDAERPGLVFADNGMRVIEVEVLELSLSDRNIAMMLDQSQIAVVASNIELENARRTLAVEKEKQRILQETAQVTAETTRVQLILSAETQNLTFEIDKKKIEGQLEILIAQFESDLKKLENDKEKTQAAELIADISHAKRLERQTNESVLQNTTATNALALKKDELESATAAAVKRFEAAKEGLFEVLTNLHREDMVAKLAQGCTIERYLSGDSAAASLSNLLNIVPSVQGFLEKAIDPKNRLAKEATK